jgi:cell wall-associated NlpC family hydrolase
VTSTARLLFSCACLWLAACAQQPVQPATPARVPLIAAAPTPAAALQARYQAWRGTPYRIGGLSQRGIDCSGFVHLTYRDLFGIDLPRNTGEQARLGEPVKAGQREIGDLVFFRINRWTNHVGIYLGQGRFMHASTSSGVMISRVDEPYWRKRYWKTTRLQQPLIAQRD